MNGIHISTPCSFSQLRINKINTKSTLQTSVHQSGQLVHSAGVCCDSRWATAGAQPIQISGLCLLPSDPDGSLMLRLRKSDFIGKRGYCKQLLEQLWKWCNACLANFLPGQCLLSLFYIIIGKATGSRQQKGGSESRRHYSLL